MSRKTNIEERRAKRRYQIKDKAFVSFPGPASCYKLGEIIDMSTGGMAFRYLNSGEGPSGKTSTNKPVELDILLDGDNYFLGQVSIRTISDSMISKVSPFLNISMRQCRLKFKELNSDQKFQLEHLIEKHTYKQEKTGPQ